MQTLSHVEIQQVSGGELSTAEQAFYTVAGCAFTFGLLAGIAWGASTIVAGAPITVLSAASAMVVSSFPSSSALWTEIGIISTAGAIVGAGIALYHST